MKDTEIIFTGQVATNHKHWETINSTVPCFVCKKTIGLRDGQLDGATGLAWLDPYRGKKGGYGKYVHFACLSEKRQKEITCPACRGTGQDDPPPGKWHGLCPQCKGSGRQ